MLISVRGVTKAYLAQLALDDVSFSLQFGRSLAIAGHNGSGKSTLVKILCGYVNADQGDGEFKGAPIDLRRRTGRWRDDVHVVHQDLGLISELSVGEQFGLGSGRTGSGGRRHTQKIAESAMDQFDVRVSHRTVVADLTRGQQALVALARVAHSWPNPMQLLVLDEVTSPLGARDVGHVFSLLRQLTKAGAGVVLVTHRPAEMLDLCEDILVLRNGRVVANLQTVQTSEARLVREIAGDGTSLPVRAMESRRAKLVGVLASGARARPTSRNTEEPGRTSTQPAAVINLAVPAGPNYSVTAAWGQIVGVVGNVGSGHDQLVSFMAAETQSGASATVGNTHIRGGQVGRLRRAGVRLMPKDRLKLGIIPTLSATENVVVALRDRPVLIRNRAADREEVGGWFDIFDITPRRPERELRLFSGGNQQKVILSRSVAANPSILIVDEPTEGVDFGARIEIVAALRAWVSAGDRAVVACLSDIDIAMELCDSVVVIRNGRTVAHCAVKEVARPELLELVAGVADVVQGQQSGSAPEESQAMTDAHERPGPPPSGKHP